mgnify:CR=1 FL=1
MSRIITVNSLEKVVWVKVVVSVNLAIAWHIKLKSMFD